jgi:threonine synthase
MNAAAGLAVFTARASGLIGPSDTVVALITGHGLKDPGRGLPAA